MKTMETFEFDESGLCRFVKREKSVAGAKSLCCRLRRAGPDVVPEVYSYGCTVVIGLWPHLALFSSELIKGWQPMVG